MIKNRRVTVATDPRGKIKTGMKRPGTEMPMSLDYFNISDFPELLKMYGEKPSELVVMPPSDNLSDIFDDTYVLYGTGKSDKPTKIRQCDGETCVHSIAEAVGTDRYGQGEDSECLCLKYGWFDSEDEQIKKKRCKYTMYARFFVANPHTGRVESPMPYLFETHSQNSGSAVHTALENMSGLTSMLTRGTPKLQLLKFRLSVKMVQSQRDAKLRFPIWELSPMGTVQDVLNRVVQIAQMMGKDEELKRLMEVKEKSGFEGLERPVSEAKDGLVNALLNEGKSKDGLFD